MNRLRRYLYVLFRRKPLLFLLLNIVVVILLLAGVAGGVAIAELGTEEEVKGRSWTEIVRSDTLRAVSVLSSTSAFQYKNEWRGHEYQIGSQVCRSLGLQMRLVIAPDVPSMLDSIKKGVADVALWPVSAEVAERAGGLRACGYKYEIGQVLVGKKKADLRWRDSSVYTLCVLKGSQQRLLLEVDSLASSLPYECLRVVEIDTDSLEGEALVGWVDAGLYDFTMVEANRAQLFRTYYNTLQLSPVIPGSHRPVSWVVAAGADTLAAKIDSLCSLNRPVPQYPSVMKRYYESGRGRSVHIRYLLGGGQLSVYDTLYQRYARELKWDWRLLAAISFVESRFDPHATSYKGAKGLMQLMPRTAEAFGCPPVLADDPESNVAAGTRLLGHLQSSLRNKLVRSRDPGLKDYAAADTALRETVDKVLPCYIIGSFHAGLGHVFDAIVMADSLGYDPLVWYDNVERCLILKKDSVYYSLPYVKLGKFAGEITSDYVNEVLYTYESFKKVASR